MDNILFFDTETTDLPRKGAETLPTQPSVIQLGAILCDPDGGVLEEFETLVKIGDKPINPYALAAHGITSSDANSKGIHKTEAFTQFYELTKEAETLCCHNYSFDIRLMQIMSAQCGMEVEDPDTYSILMSEILELPYYCTMKSTISFCALPFPSGRKGHKFPKLEELHQILFEESFEGAHDALTDVRATVKCFFELRKRGLI